MRSTKFYFEGYKMSEENAVNTDSAPVEEENDVNNTAKPSTAESDVNDEQSSSSGQHEDVASEEEEQTVPLSRLNEVISKRRESDRQVAEMQARLEALEQTSKAPVNDAEPTLEDFDYDEDKFTDALVEFKVNKRITENESSNKQKQLEATAQDNLNRFNTAAATYMSANPGYKQAVDAFGNTMIAQNVANAILESDNAPAIHHALLNDVEQLSKLENMPANQMYREFGRLEASLIKGVKTAKKKTTNAPTPIDVSTQGATGKSEPSEKEKEAMSVAQWRAYREGK